MTDGPGEQLIAALDIGTNSFHLVVARVGTHGIEVVARERETVRLGHGGGDMKQISPEALERGISALHRMHSTALGLAATERAVATSAVREAENADAFISRARSEVGVEIEVISGLEEARLIHLGVLHALPVFEARLLLIDIGGGSTELLVGRRGRASAVESLELGAVRLTDRFFPDGDVAPTAVESCRSYARSMLAPFAREVHVHGFDVAAVSSGTAETVASMVHAARSGAPLRTFNGFEFERNELEHVVTELCRHPTAASRRAVAGLRSGRADIIVAGALVLHEIATIYNVDRFTFSAGALREGLLIDTVAKLRNPQARQTTE